MTARRASRVLDAGQMRLRLMSTADLHMAILPYDYLADAPSEGPSLVALAAVVARLRAEATREGRACLLFDSGDFLQGSPMADYYGLERGLRPGETHPMIAAMNALGYAAGALGNHEFNYGVEFLEAALAGARFPLLCANLARQLGPTPSDDLPFCPPRTLLEVAIPPGGGTGRLRIGVFGLTPPGTVHWESAQIRGRLAARPMREAAAGQAAALRAEGADLVVALVHGGINGDPAPPQIENQALPLARLDGLDVLLLGHTHEVFPAKAHPARPGIDAVAGTIHGRPAVQAGLRASHLGVIDLDLERKAAGGGWTIAGAAVRAVPVPRVPVGAEAMPPPRGPAPRPATPRMAGAQPAAGFAEAPACPDPGQPGDPGGLAAAIAAAAAEAHAETRRYIARPVGRTRIALHTYFAQLGQSAALRLIARAKREWAAAQIAGTPHAGLPLVAVPAPFRAGGQGGPRHYTHVPPGAVLIRHIHDLYEFPNCLRVLRIDGRGLAEWLERVAGLYNRLSPATPDAPVIVPEAPGYYFDLGFGVSYGFDLAAPARYDTRGALVDPGARRVVDLRLGDAPLDPDADLLLVTNNYRAAGGGGFPGTGPELARVVVESALTNRAAVLDHVRRLGEVTEAAADGGCRLLAPPGTTALFDTSPAAAGHLDEIADYAPEPLGLTEAGFLRLRLRF